jgi:hypothetical protein
MGFNGAVADAQLGCNLLVGATSRDTQQHLAFPAGEQVQPGIAGPVLTPDGRAETGGHGSTEVGLAAAHGSDGGPELGCGGVFEEVTVRAGSHTLEHVLGVVVHAEDEDPGGC